MATGAGDPAEPAQLADEVWIHPIAYGHHPAHHFMAGNQRIAARPPSVVKHGDIAVA